MCRLRGIAYDTESKIGTLFFLPDSILGGGISVLCMGRTRKKSLELAIQTLTFVQKNYGLDVNSGTNRHYENLSSILSNLKKVIKKEGDLPIRTR